MQRPSVSVSLLRFLAVGGTVALVYSVVTAALIAWAGAPPVLTGALLWLACIPLAFHAQRRFAFGADRTRRMAFPIYLATQLASLMLVSGVSAVFVTRVFLTDTLIYLAATAAAAVLSFLIARFVTFAPVGSTR